MAEQKFNKRIPPIMLPHQRRTFEKYKQYQWPNPLPKIYKHSLKALRKVVTENIPLDRIISSKKRHQADSYKLASIAIDRNAETDYLLRKFEILEKTKFLDRWLAKVIITDLLWCNQKLKSLAKEVEAIKYYEEDLRDTYLEVRNIIKNPIDKKRLNLPTYVRINILSISIDDTLHAFCKEGWNLLPRCSTYSEYLNVLTNLSDTDFIRDYHISELLVFPPGTSFYNHPGYLKGKFVLQDKGSCLSSFLLNPKPESVVLDACAAPGMKTNHLANIMDNKGLIYANDIHPARFETLCQFLELTDITCVQPLLDDFLNIKINNPEDIKYILIDPTCSYSGLFFDSNRTNQKHLCERNQFMLSMILRHALQNFPNVKRVIYTTCSLYPEEGEKVVDEALQDIGNSYSLLDVREMLWNEWESVGLPEYICGNKCLRIVPEVDLCQGYFIAVFERDFNIPVPPYTRKYKIGSKVYNSDELKKIEKITPTGKIIETYVPKDKKEMTEEEKNEKLRQRMIKKSERTNKFIMHRMKKYKKWQDRTKFKWQADTTNTNNSTPDQICETTHSQLYP